MNLKTIIKSELLFESLEDRLKSAFQKWCKKMKLKDQDILDDIKDVDGFPEELADYNSDLADYYSEAYEEVENLYAKRDYEGIHKLIANHLCRDEWIKREFKEWLTYRNLTKSSDIFQYKSEGELGKELRDAKEKSFTKKLKKASAGKDFDKIWENDDMLIVVPKSHIGACKFGQGTKWCTASKTNNYFDSYYEKGILYRVLQKNNNYKELFSNFEGLDKSDIENLSKVSINLRRKENSMSMVDKVDYAYGDKLTSEFLNSLPYEGYKAIKNYQSLNEQNIKKIIREEMEKYEHVDIVHMIYFPSTNQILDKEGWIDADYDKLPGLKMWDTINSSISTKWYYDNGFLDKYWKPDEILKEVKAYLQDVADQFAGEDHEYYQRMANDVTLRSFVIRVGIEEIKTDSSFFDKL